MLLAVVLGGMTEGHKGWRSWPIDPDRVAVGAGSDAEQARTLANYLKLDNAGWLHVLWKANQLGRRQDFRRLAVLIADELERVEVLTAEDLERLMTRDAGSGGGVMEKKRSIFPTSITTLDGARRVPTEAELDRMLFQLVIGQLRGNDPGPAPEPAVPTDAELRDQARALGLPVPRTLREKFRGDMLNLLNR